jgi:hypothetical protein
MENEQSEALPCEGKLAFDTKEQANATASVTAYHRGTRLKAYRCKHCGLWHLASNHGDHQD